MVCSDVYEGAMVPMKSPGASLMLAEERLSALSPSERQHFLDSVAYHKNMLVELIGRTCFCNRIPFACKVVDYVHAKRWVAFDNNYPFKEVALECLLLGQNGFQ